MKGFFDSGSHQDQKKKKKKKKKNNNNNNSLNYLIKRFILPFYFFESNISGTVYNVIICNQLFIFYM
jgi:hypothetical protein